ncbi:hypothetical protein LXL04_009229 [Taraxacum kok-saghyz]
MIMKELPILRCVVWIRTWSQVSVLAMIRTSANWEGKKVRKKKPKKNKNCVASDNEVGGDGVGLRVLRRVWLFLKCGVARRVVSGRGKVDGEKINLREFHFIGLKTILKDYSPFLQRGGRRMVHPEELSFFDTDSGIPHHRFDAFGSRHHRHLRHRSPEGLAEIVMLQGNLLMGGRLDHDRYRDWRLDVDTMSYEELLELGDKIGYVSTGLREDEIGRYVRKTKPPNMSDFKSSPHFPNEMQWKCTICQVCFF